MYKYSKIISHGGINMTIVSSISKNHATPKPLKKIFKIVKNLEKGTKQSFIEMDEFYENPQLPLSPELKNNLKIVTAREPLYASMDEFYENPKKI